MLSHRRTKIVATIGPATSSREKLKEAIQSGMNVARLNFSHGTHQDHKAALDHLRSLSRELKAPVTILQDLQGPKIRLGLIENDEMRVEQGQKVIITTKEELGKGGRISSDFKELPDCCEVGTKIFIDDGLIELRVVEVGKQEVHCEVIFGGILKSRKGMNLPGVQLPVECLTSKDKKDLEFGLKNKVDYVALSFVRCGDDMRKIRQMIQERNLDTKVVAKIEMLEAITNLEEIIRLSDAVMVARGDLAVEVGQSQLPGIQKRIIRLCNELRCPVITATQMLDSMVENPRPTRAEVTDVANAVMEGSDALMLSAETASGQHPFKCIRTMHEIILEVEKNERAYYEISVNPGAQIVNIPEAIAASACLSALKLQASVIVCLTTTGRTATLISSSRPRSRIIAMTHLEDTLNCLELAWGIQTFQIEPYTSTDEAMIQVETLLLGYGLVKRGDQVVLTLGVPVQEKSKTNSIRVFTVKGGTDPLPREQLPLRCQSL